MGIDNQTVLNFHFLPTPPGETTLCLQNVQKQITSPGLSLPAIISLAFILMQNFEADFRNPNRDEILQIDFFVEISL